MEREMIIMMVDTLPIFYYENGGLRTFKALRIWSSPVKGSMWVRKESNLAILLGRMRKLGQMKRVRTKKKPML